MLELFDDKRYLIGFIILSFVIFYYVLCEYKIKDMIRNELKLKMKKQKKQTIVQNENNDNDSYADPVG